ncbi:MAG: transcription-repair coupling factor, partial [Lentisphaerae bacterium]|nr:transcription-repair coupling factor [Lentisphaerota bacterium]
QTAPRERLPVETVVTHSNDATIRQAIINEISRGGQVFYLHNRVMTIDLVRHKLERIVPEARIATAHGRMRASELADIMRGFCKHDFDVLLCTTIIESGMDIPNVNTIIIDRADRFGLAELHQLRGRVGRSTRKAFAYLLLAPHGKVAQTARKRLSAIMRHTELGSGFKLALRDLEIRGAGNILGAAQSGHIATVGFDLYCQLLRAAIEQLKTGKIVPDESAIINVVVDLDFINESGYDDDGSFVRIPATYIEDESVRVRLYRRISAVNTLEQPVALSEELTDRFGPVPPPLTRLLKIAGIRVAAASKGIVAIQSRNGKLHITGKYGLITEHGKLIRLTGKNPDALLDEIKNKILALKI